MTWRNNKKQPQIVLAGVTHYENTLLYAEFVFLRRDEDLIVAAVMRSVQIFAPQGKHAL